MSKGASKNGQKIASNGHDGNGRSVVPSNFSSTLISTIPHSRKGKHNLIVAKILDDLSSLPMEKAVLIPLDHLDGEKMENVRSALNRATRQRDMLVATATDEKYFYVWRTEQKDPQAAPPSQRTLTLQSREPPPALLRGSTSCSHLTGLHVSALRVSIDESSRRGWANLALMAIQWAARWS